jgi:hypothetical protein
VLRTIAESLRRSELDHRPRQHSWPCGSSPQFGGRLSNRPTPCGAVHVVNPAGDRCRKGFRKIFSQIWYRCSHSSHRHSGASVSLHPLRSMIGRAGMFRPSCLLLREVIRNCGVLVESNDANRSGCGVHPQRGQPKGSLPWTLGIAHRLGAGVRNDRVMPSHQPPAGVQESGCHSDGEL